jgi:DNA-binding response OmpR family regulator
VPFSRPRVRFDQERHRRSDRAMGQVSKVLVVEDEPFVALDVAATLSTAGWEVVGPAFSVERALQLIEQKGCDAAVLDTNLSGESAAPVAEALQTRSIPFMVLSGYAIDKLPDVLLRVPFLAKPYNPTELATLVRSLCASYILAS